MDMAAPQLSNPNVKAQMPNKGILPILYSIGLHPLFEIWILTFDIQLKRICLMSWWTVQGFDASIHQIQALIQAVSTPSFRCRAEAFHHARLNAPIGP